MKHYLLLSILFLQILTFTTVLASAPDDTNAIALTSIETNGYYFAACITNINLRVGDAFIVTTILKNISTNDVTVVLASPLRTHEIKIIHGKEIIPMTLYGKSSKLTVISMAKRTLKPGEQITESFPTNRFFDMNAAGDYEVIISRWIRIHDGTESVTITSPPLKITLKEP